MHEVKKLRYSHEALADMLLANPQMTHKELATAFDRSPVWVGYVIASDAFQAFLAKRREEIVDPILTMTVEEKLRGLVNRSSDLLMEKLTPAMKPELLLETLKVGTKALGYGQRQPDAGMNVQFVVALPNQAPSPEAWQSAYAGGNLQAGEGVIDG